MYIQNTYSRREYEQNRMKRSNISTIHPNDTNKGDHFGGPNDPCNSDHKSQESHPDTYTVYIDGSCVHNGSVTASAGYGLFWGDNHPWNCSLSLSNKSIPTNHTAELTAAIRAVQIAEKNQLNNLIIKSDSKYVIRGVSEWSQKWTENDWKTINGDNILNRDEWIELIDLIKSTKVNINWQFVQHTQE